MRTIATVLATLAAALGASAFAQQTTIQVPQGSGVFPTVGQINCLEDAGSGRYCAATYECSGGVSGELWGDLANHDGRRAIGTDSPVARQRDCVITVDGKAAVRWLTGYSPGGRTGDLVGLTTSADALQPIQRIQQAAGEAHDSLLAYALARYDISIREYVESGCDHIRVEAPEYSGCVLPHYLDVVSAVDVPATPFGKCMIEWRIERFSGGQAHNRRHAVISDVIGSVLRRFVGASARGYRNNLGQFDHPCFQDARSQLREHGIEIHDNGHLNLEDLLDG